MANSRLTLTVFERVQERIFKKWMQDLRDLAQFIQFSKTLKKERLYEFFQNVLLGLTSGESFSTYQYLEQHLPGLIEANVSAEACLIAFSDLRNHLLNTLIRDRQLSVRERRQWTNRLLSFFDNLNLFLQKQFYLTENKENNINLPGRFYPETSLPFCTFTAEGDRFHGNIRFNSRWSEWTGLMESGQSLAHDWPELIPEEDWKELQTAVKEIARKKQTFYQVEYRLKFRDRKWHKVVENGKVFYDSQGKPLFFSGAIFAGSISENVLPFFSQFAGALLDAHPLPCFLTDARARLIYANPSFHKLMGKPLSFRDTPSVSSLFTPEHARIVQTSIGKLMEIKKDEITEEMYFRSVSGKTIDRWRCRARIIEKGRHSCYFFELQPAEPKPTVSATGPTDAEKFFRKLDLIHQAARGIRREGINSAQLKNLLKTAMQLCPEAKSGQIFLQSADGYIPVAAVGAKISAIRKIRFFEHIPEPAWLKPGVKIIAGSEILQALQREMNPREFTLIEENLKLSETVECALMSLAVNGKPFAMLKLDRQTEGAPFSKESVAWLSHLLRHSDDALEWIRLTRDSSEKKEQVAVNPEISSLPAAILQNEKFVLRNPQFCKIFSCSEGKDYCATIKDLMDKSGLAGWQALAASLKSGKNNRNSFEFQGKAGGKGGRFYKAFVKPVKYRGKPAILMEFVDISRQKELEQQLLQLQRLETVNALSAGMTHDFNNILGAIIPSAEIILTRKTDPIVQRHAELIFKMSQRASVLVTQLLSFARLDSFSREPVNLSALLKEIKEMIAKVTGSTVLVRYELCEKLPAIEANRNQLLQCIMNLVINARDAMNGSGDLTIRTKSESVAAEGRPESPAEKPKKIVKLIISDSGEGIPEHILPKIFDPLFTTKLPQQGTGLGLNMVKKIVESHQGTVEVYSREGLGTTFELSFPATRRKAARKKLPHRRKFHRGSGKILVIDDEDELLEVLGSMLSIMGYEPLLASNGNDGVDLFRKHRAELKAVLLDYAVPGFSGKEIFHEFKKIDKQAKIIICTGFGKSEALRDLNSLPIAGLLTKPFTLETIGALLKKVLSA